MVLQNCLISNRIRPNAERDNYHERPAGRGQRGENALLP